MQLRTKTPGRVLPAISALWSPPHQQWIDWLTAGALSDASLYQRSYHLRRVALDHPARSPWDLTTEDLSAWLACQQWSRATLRSYRATLRSFYGWAHDSGRLERNPAALLRAIKPSQPRPRAASEAAIDEALRVADPATRLAIALAATCGLRRGELARIHSHDLYFDGGWILTVHGKGGKTRDIPIEAEVALQVRSAQGWLFPSPRREGQPLTAAVLGKRISRCLPEGVVTHQLRHRFATVIYRRGADIMTVKELLGHASVATTQIYVSPRHEAAREAMRLAS